MQIWYTKICDFITAVEMCAAEVKYVCCAYSYAICKCIIGQGWFKEIGRSRKIKNK